MKDIAATIQEGKKLVDHACTQDTLLAFLSRSDLTFLEAIKAVRQIYAIDLRAAMDICAASGRWQRDEETTPSWRFRGVSNGKIIEASGDGAFDELVVSPWLHIERLDDNYYWLRIGELAVELTIESGKVKRRRRRAKADRG